jgi:hypothetical protein
VLEEAVVGEADEKDDVLTPKGGWVTAIGVEFGSRIVEIKEGDDAGTLHKTKGESRRGWRRTRFRVLEEAVVGEADEERRFAARDMVPLARSTETKQQEQSQAAFLQAEQPQRLTLERDKRRGRKASTVDRV